VALAFVTRESNLAGAVEVTSGFALSDANVFDTLLFGLAGGSAGSSVKQFFKARDNHDTQAEPGLATGHQGTTGGYDRG
jgi:hypothetical protein